MIIAALCGADGALVKCPVGAGDGVPGLGKEFLGSPTQCAAFLVGKADGVWPDLSAFNTGSQVSGGNQVA